MSRTHPDTYVKDIKLGQGASLTPFLGGGVKGGADAVYAFGGAIVVKP